MSAVRDLTPTDGADGPDPRHSDGDSFAELPTRTVDTWILHELRRTL